MPPTRLFGLSFFPARSRRRSCLLSLFEQKLVPQWPLLVECAPVRPNLKSCAVCRQCVQLLWVPHILQAQAHLFRASFTTFVSKLFSQTFPPRFRAQTSSSFLRVSFQKTAPRFFLEMQCRLCEHRFFSLILLVLLRHELFSDHCVLCFSSHLHMWSQVSGSIPHAGQTSHASLTALNKASHVQIPLMCIDLSCPRCHCVRCLDLNKRRDTALSVPFAASFLRSSRVIIPSRTPQGFSSHV